jgi:hypothetical protein
VHLEVADLLYERSGVEIKVLRAEHAGLLEQKLADIRLQHYQKVEEELESLRSQSAARLEQLLYVFIPIY